MLLAEQDLAILNGEQYPNRPPGVGRIDCEKAVPVTKMEW